MTRSPQRREPQAGKYHQFLWPASQPVQHCDIGAVRRGAIQKPRPSRVRSKASFGPCTDAVTQRVTAATARPGRSALFGRTQHSSKRPG